MPAVHDLLKRLPPDLACLPHGLLVSEIRRVLDQIRLEIRQPRADDSARETAVEARVTQAIRALFQPSLRRVINATGVVLHTNLGRAPLGTVRVEPGYSNLEYDLVSGRRGKRDVHTAAVLERLLGAPAITVNNNAAAVFLALHELAAGGEVIVSRGELIEIGDGFRIPDIMARSGAVLREVGTTNRTRVEDYRDAIGERTRLLLRVHPSNFRITGFTARPTVQELAALAREKEIPLYEDLGSGCLFDLRPYGIDEPLVAESLAAGAHLVSFSGDKLLGGPQAGILAGQPDLITRLRRNPLYRALRLDKIICQVLESTLQDFLLERWDEIPALRMIRQSADEIRTRAERLLSDLPSLGAQIIPGRSVIGGGATPDQSLPTWLIAFDSPNPSETERALRSGDPPILARIENEKLLFDLRTVFPEEEEILRARLAVYGE
jgi:L-seryl-tRNA(Ser) seleniumtransferase